MNRYAGRNALRIVASCLALRLLLCLVTIAISAGLTVTPAESQAAPASPSATQAPSTSPSNTAASQASTTSSAAPTAQEIASAKASGKVWVNTETGVYHKSGRW